jgi:hypothetical protein
MQWLTWRFESYYVVRWSLGLRFINTEAWGGTEPAGSGRTATVEGEVREWVRIFTASEKTVRPKEPIGRDRGAQVHLISQSHLLCYLLLRKALGACEGDLRNMMMMLRPCWVMMKITNKIDLEDEVWRLIKPRLQHSSAMHPASFPKDPCVDAYHGRW